MRFSFSHIVLVSLALQSCAQEGGALDVTPESLTLLEQGDEQAVTLDNVGNGELTIEQITASPVGAFTLSGVELPQRLAAGEQAIVTVTKTGPEPCGERSGGLEITWISAGQTLTDEVPLDEGRLEGSLGADPSEVVFDALELDTRDRIALAIANTGTCVASFTDVILTGSERFFLVERGTLEPPSTQLTLAPDERTDWEILFAPENQGCHQGTLILRIDSGDGLSVSLIGPTAGVSCDDL